MAKQKIGPAYNVKILYLSIVFVILIIIVLGYATFNPVGFFCILGVSPGSVGCGGGGGGGSGFDFSIFVNPTSGSTVAGDRTSTVVSLSLYRGSTQSVSLSCPNLPGGIVCRFEPTSCPPSCTSLLTLPVSSLVSPGNYTITIAGTSSRLTKSTTYTLSVLSPPPKITISSPTTTTYYKTKIPLTFTIDKPTSSLSYNLDNQSKVSITGSTNLNIQDVAFHRVTVDATDTYGSTGYASASFYTCIGDVNRDGLVNSTDTNIVYSAQFTTVGNPNYNSNADLDDDGVIDIDDVVLVFTNQGKRCSLPDLLVNFTGTSRLYFTISSPTEIVLWSRVFNTGSIKTGAFTDRFGDILSTSNGTSGGAGLGIIGYYNFTGIDAGDSSTAIVNWKNFGYGTHTIEHHVDFFNSISESNENNNIAYDNITIGISDATRPVLFGGYYIYATQGVDNQWVKLEIRNSAGSIVETTFVNELAAATLTTSRLTIGLLNIRAAQDGTVLGADLVVFPWYPTF